VAIFRTTRFLIINPALLSDLILRAMVLRPLGSGLRQLLSVAQRALAGYQGAAGAIAATDCELAPMIAK
jgi:hypothetical protein